MDNISAIVLFCDDIREEKSGAHSLMGIMGDNVEVPGFPGAINRVAIYVRINLPLSFDPCLLKLVMHPPSDEPTVINEIDEGLVARSISEARDLENPIAGIYSKMVASPFPTPVSGRYWLELSWKDNSHFLGSLNVVEVGTRPDKESDVTEKAPS